MSYDMPIAVVPEFRVLYEDDGVLVVDKAAPLLTHPTGEKNEPTLWHGLHELLAFEVATGGQVSLINRLDRETSGITLVAKTQEAARELGKAMQARLLHKEYYAVVQGTPLWETACCAEPILRMEDVAETRIHVRQCCHPAGKDCRTSAAVGRCRCCVAALIRDACIRFACTPPIWATRWSAIRYTAAMIAATSISSQQAGLPTCSAGSSSTAMLFMLAASHFLGKAVRLRLRALCRQTWRSCWKCDVGAVSSCFLFLLEKGWGAW